MMIDDHHQQSHQNLLHFHIHEKKKYGSNIISWMIFVILIYGIIFVADKIYPVVKNQHLLLCTLLIGNALAMESLPIFLGKLIPPSAAVLLSVTLILMFGEVCNCYKYNN
ncbi:hypothetical protein L1887_09391 [Cichorium endivia]|nr:hypothetical protein L1887_09391 [Cichorium endivia]